MLSIVSMGPRIREDDGGTRQLGLSISKRMLPMKKTAEAVFLA